MKYPLLVLCSLLFCLQDATSQTDTLIPEGLQFRNIGPANQGGRIVDIEAYDDDFTNVYVATGSGGVWHSDNAGTTWTPIFDDYETASIGDIAIDQNQKNVLWVGTGEANNRNSVSWGNGVYKSTDGGVSFKHLGLESTHQIARISVNPDNSDDVCVCAIGHLWGYSGERGLFQTKNGGNQWAQLNNGLPNDGKTGCIDLVRDPNNSNTLYAAFYHRLRQPWHFHSGGGQGGIYKSVDNGKSWKQLTNGLPNTTGRIGLAIYDKDPNILMAIVEANQSTSLDNIGSGIYRTEDGGDSWSYVNTYNNRPFYYSQIRINPHDDQRVYMLTTRFMVSTDGGTNIANGSPDYEVHGDYHAMWLDPNDPDRYYLGADKGLSLTHDHGEAFRLMDNLPIGQFYRINYDMQDPYYIYGGLQDNGSYAVASFSRDARGILTDDNWKMHWGDGQDAAINPYDVTDAYSSMENGSYFKYNPKTRDINRVSPTPFNTPNFGDYIKNSDEAVSSELRYNWSAPLMMSPHDPSTIYVAGNHVFKSTDQGTSWRVISPDLSTNDPIKRKQGISGGITPDNTGAEAHCAVHTLSLSPIDPNILWAGTDDGLIQVSTDDGANWTEVSKNIPGYSPIWVSRIEASHFTPGRAYVTMDGHRSDIVRPMVYRTDNYGATWQKITNGIGEHESVRVIREDVVDPNLLFIGTETGVWISQSRGDSWTKMHHGLPTVSVYDIKIHPRDHDLIIGTHGRSIWIMDDISALRKKEASFYFPSQSITTIWNNISRGGQRGHFWWAGENPGEIVNTSSIPRANFESYSPITFEYNGTDTLIQMTVAMLDQSLESSYLIKVKLGINRVYWDRVFDIGCYTDDQKAEIHAVFDRLVQMPKSNAIKRAYERFKLGDCPMQKRIINSFAGPYRGGLIPNGYADVTAGPGSYRVSISDGDQAISTTISIRNDPMNE